MPPPINSRVRAATCAVVIALAGCDAAGSDAPTLAPADGSTAQPNPSLAADAASPSGANPAVDGGAPGAADAAQQPGLDASVLDGGGAAVPDDAALDANPVLDGAGLHADAQAVEGGANPQDAGPQAGDAQQDAAVRVPVFQKTRCIDPAKVKADTEQNFPCDSIDVWIVVPRQCFTQACGLVFNIHGGGMGDHVTMDQATNMIALGSRADYIVVHPHKGTWSVANDRNTVFGFMQQVIQAFDVDKKRVHSTGYSQGGQISWALACEHADVIASVAPTEEINRVTDCWKTSKLPSRMPSVLFAYGKQDSIGGGYAAAQKLVEQFVAGHQLRGPETIAGAPSAKYWRQRWSAADGNVLEFITQDYTSSGVLGVLAGHCLPMDTGKTFVSCSTPVDYNWGEEVIRFFRAHPMP